MKTWEELQELLPTSQDSSKWNILAEEGFLFPDQVTLVENALKIPPELMSIAEKKVIVDLLESFSSLLVSESESKVTNTSSIKNTVADKNIPLVLILKRKSIRMYPDNQKVALYYSQTLDRYFTLPFGPKSEDSPLMEALKLKLRKLKKSSSSWKDLDDEDFKNLPHRAQQQYLKNRERAKSADAYDRMLKSTPTRELYKHAGGPGEAASRGGGTGHAGIDAANRLGIRFGVALRRKLFAPKDEPEKKTTAPAQAQASPPEKTKAPKLKRKVQEPVSTQAKELPKHQDNLSPEMEKLHKDYSRFSKLEKGVDSKSKIQVKTSGPESERYHNRQKHYSDIANRFREKIQSAGGTPPSVQVKKRVIGPTKRPSPGTIKPPVVAEGALELLGGGLKRFWGGLRGAAGGFARGVLGVQGDEKEAPKRKTQSDALLKKKEAASTGSNAQKTGHRIINTHDTRVSPNAQNIRNSMAAFANQYGRLKENAYFSHQEEVDSVLELIQPLSESNGSQINLDFPDQSFLINDTMARKFMDVYESLNKKNKKQMEKMLNESADSFKKVISFSIRQ